MVTFTLKGKPYYMSERSCCFIKAVKPGETDLDSWLAQGYGVKEHYSNQKNQGDKVISISIWRWEIGDRR